MRMPVFLAALFCASSAVAQEPAGGANLDRAFLQSAGLTITVDAVFAAALGHQTGDVGARVVVNPPASRGPLQSAWSGSSGIGAHPSTLGVVDAGAAIMAGDIGVVPEPISMVLLGTGLAGIGAAARRRRRHADS